MLKFTRKHVFSKMWGHWWWYASGPHTCKISLRISTFTWWNWTNTNYTIEFTFDISYLSKIIKPHYFLLKPIYLMYLRRRFTILLLKAIVIIIFQVLYYVVVENKFATVLWIWGYLLAFVFVYVILIIRISFLYFIVVVHKLATLIFVINHNFRNSNMWFWLCLIKILHLLHHWWLLLLNYYVLSVYYV